MPQKHPFESSFIYGLHDVGGERFMLEAATPGWVCVSEPVGIDPTDREGKDYTHLIKQGLSVMVRLNAGYSGVGTTPFEKYYDDFAQRCANFVQASGDVHIWIVGNEPNHPVEWPGADWDWGKAQPRTENSVGEKITPQRYVKVYLMVREAIHGLDGHENDLVLTAAIAPWNALCTYPGNATGDWVTYFRDVLDLLGPENCDGITLHTYTHGPDPQQIDAEDRMSPPFQNRHYHFRAYQDFMDAIPLEMQHLPVYITETDQNEPWRNENIDWVKLAYGEIDYWNKQHPFRPIRALVLYRWSHRDQWYLEGKQGVIEDFRESLQSHYRWDGYEHLAPDYRALYSVQESPEFVLYGDVFVVSLRIRNVGKKRWKKEGDHAIYLRYDWEKADGKKVRAKHYDTVLPNDVLPGDWVDVEVAIAAPKREGAFTLVISLARTGTDSFGGKDAEPVKIPLKVKRISHGEAIRWLWRYIQQLKEENNNLKRWFLGIEGPQLPSTRTKANGNDASSPSFGDDSFDLEAGSVIVKPAMQEIVDRLPHSKNKRYDRRELGQITHITVHHSAAPASISPQRIAEYHVYSHKWPGMGYHFYIGADGTIYHTQDMHRISYHVANNNSYTVGVCLAGNFTRTVPPKAQLEAAARLIAWLMEELRIPLEYVLGHKEYPRTSTACPGYQWDHEKRWKKLLWNAITEFRKNAGAPKIEKKPIQHYVLFWKHSRNRWAKNDWLAAAAYIGRFGATAGFSEEEARLARFVTIIGGPTGVSSEVETRLQETGCIVQRVAGKSEQETKRLLEKLARQKTPFLKV